MNCRFLSDLIEFIFERCENCDCSFAYGRFDVRLVDEAFLPARLAREA